MRDRPIANPRDFMIALIAWVVGMLVASRMADTESVAVRAVAVAVGLMSVVPYARIVVGGIRQSDEYARRVHVLAIGIGFGGVAFTIMAIDWIQRARFIGPIRTGGLGLLVVILWWGVGMLAASRYYR